MPMMNTKPSHWKVVAEPDPYRKYDRGHLAFYRKRWSNEHETALSFFGIPRYGWHREDVYDEMGNYLYLNDKEETVMAAIQRFEQAEWNKAKADERVKRWSPTYYVCGLEGPHFVVHLDMSMHGPM